MTPTVEQPTPTADALDAWLAEIERMVAEMDPGDAPDLDPPPWAVEAWENL